MSRKVQKKAAESKAEVKATESKITKLKITLPLKCVNYLTRVARKNKVSRSIVIREIIRQAYVESCAATGKDCQAWGMMKRC